MCGIAGFFNRDGRIASEVLLERMIERINHRGPDDKGTWTQGSLGFGHCRLNILDLSSQGHQPFVTQDGKGVISYNGEVYNFKELRSELEKEGIKFKSATDTEVVLYALQQWGPEKATLLFNGMFAFAYFDLRNKTLWLARDRAGIKPLYVARAGSLFAFASEIKAFFGHPGIPCRPDLHALTTQLVCHRLDGSWTAFENIESLTPGTILKVKSDTDESIQYFDLLSDLNVDRLKEASRTDFDHWVREFEKIFSSNVKSHLVSDAPLAVMLSGGLDSSIMTAYAKPFKSDLVGYVADVPDLEVSEVLRAEKVAEYVGIKLRLVKVNHDDYIRRLPSVVYQNDQPNYFPQNPLFAAIAETAHRDGFKVLLSGEGSDELFGGYPWHVEMYRMWRMRRLHSFLVPNLAPIRAFGKFLNRFTPLDFNQLAKKPFEHISKWTDVDEKRQFFAIDGGQRRRRAETIFKKLEGIEPLEERVFLASTFDDFYCQLRNLLISNDKMGMANSIEARVPFLESQLIDFAMHLPCRAKFDKGVQKRIVKKAAEKLLPHDIVYARKIGFATSNKSWCHTRSLLKGGAVAELFKWDKSNFEQICDQIFSDRSMALHVTCMELWARIYFRGESPDQLSEELIKINFNQKNISNNLEKAAY